MSTATRYTDDMEETATATKKHQPFYVEVEWRDWGGKWPHESDDPEQILKQVLGMLTMNAKSPKWVKANVKVTVYRNRAIHAYHDPDETD